MDEFLILLVLNIPSRVCMNITSVVFTRMASTTCSMVRMRPFSLAWLRAVHRGGIGGTTNYNGKELVGIIEAWKNGDIEIAREKQNFAQEGYQRHLPLPW